MNALKQYFDELGKSTREWSCPMRDEASTSYIGAKSSTLSCPRQYLQELAATLCPAACSENDAGWAANFAGLIKARSTGHRHSRRR